MPTSEEADEPAEESEPAEDPDIVRASSKVPDEFLNKVSDPPRRDGRERAGPAGGGGCQPESLIPGGASRLTWRAIWQAIIVREFFCDATRQVTQLFGTEILQLGAGDKAGGGWSVGRWRMVSRPVAGGQSAGGGWSVGRWWVVGRRQCRFRSCPVWSRLRTAEMVRRVTVCRCEVTRVVCVNRTWRAVYRDCVQQCTRALTPLLAFTRLSLAEDGPGAQPARQVRELVAARRARLHRRGGLQAQPGDHQEPARQVRVAEGAAEAAAAAADTAPRQQVHRE